MECQFSASSLLCSKRTGWPVAAQAGSRPAACVPSNRPAAGSTAGGSTAGGSTAGGSNAPMLQPQPPLREAMVTHHKQVVCQVAVFVGTVHTFSSARAMTALRLALALRAGAAASASFERAAIQSLSPRLAHCVNIGLTSWGASSMPGRSATAITQQLMSTDKPLAFSV